MSINYAVEPPNNRLFGTSYFVIEELSFFGGQGCIRTVSIWDLERYFVIERMHVLYLECRLSELPL